jgi:hypothetical protein
MFRLLARLIANPNPAPNVMPRADVLFAVHPIQLSHWLEEMWAAGGIANWPVIGPVAAPLGDPNVVLRLQLPNGLRDGTLQSGINPPVPPPPPARPVLPPLFVPSPPPALGTNLGALPWDHLMYAFLVESTGAFQILGEVVRRYALGESLQPPDVDTLVWARATEELFFRDPPLFSIGGLTSKFRPNPDVNRRMAYWRMFGSDIPAEQRGGADDDEKWKREVGPIANTGFYDLWNELLRQVWQGIVNDRNTSGPNLTDPNFIAYLCQTIGEMLRLRRRGGMLAREEFTYVSIMSWFHLTLEVDSPVVVRLNAEAGAQGNPADRLAALGARVGMSPNRAARALFELADLVSPILWFIELGQFDLPANAAVLYQSGGPAMLPIPALLNRVIDLWQSATGASIKDQVVSTRERPALLAGAQPSRLPTLPVTSVTAQPASRNGRP